MPRVGSDRYGQAVTTASPRALAAYVEAVDLILAAAAGADEAFGRALAEDPDLAVAHAGRARARQLAGRVAEAREAAARARTCAAAATPRERGHVEALARIAGGEPGALDAVRAHCAAFPRDAMVLAPATGVFGLIGFSGHPDRERQQVELLESLAPHYGDDWWFVGARAFAHVESGRRDSGRRLAGQALALNPRNANAAHIRAHAHYEDGDSAAGRAFVAAWLSDYPVGSPLHCHLAWHVAVFDLALGRPERAWEILADSVAPGAGPGTPVNRVTDGASLLWRLELHGQPRALERWREVDAYTRTEYPRPGVAFIDVHRALCLAATGDAAGLDTLVRELRDLLDAGRLAAGEIVPVLATALGAFARGDWGAVIALLAPRLDQIVRIGGSRAQRDCFEHTLLLAYLKTGRLAEAGALADRLPDRAPAHARTLLAGIS
jgi:hypothetical protein